MKTNSFAGVWIIVGLVVLWTGALSAAEDKAGLIIKVGGNNSLVQSAENWGKAYSQQNPGVVVVAQGGGGAEALNRLLSKELDIIFEADALSDKDKNMASEKGVELVEHFVAWGGVCAAVHPENPVESLTLDQIRKIFTGETKSWKEVGGKDIPVQPFIRDEESSKTHSTFHERFLLGKAPSGNVQRATSFPRLLRMMEEDAGSIAFVGCLALTSIKNNLKVLALKKDADSPAVKWSAETFKDHSYPLARPLFFYWNAKSMKAPPLKKFADYCTSMIWDGKCHVVSDELCWTPPADLEDRISLVRPEGAVSGLNY